MKVSSNPLKSRAGLYTSCLLYVSHTADELTRVIVASFAAVASKESSSIVSPSRSESLPRTSIVTGVASAVDASSSTASGSYFS